MVRPRSALNPAFLKLLDSYVLPQLAHLPDQQVRDAWLRNFGGLHHCAAFTPNNKISIFHDTADAYEAMWGSIQRAQRSVDLMTYILRYDTVGIHTLALLKDAAERGCKVRLSYDAAGCLSLNSPLNKPVPDPLEELRAAGAEVVCWRPFISYTIRYVSKLFHQDVSPILRNHRKLLIIDPVLPSSEATSPHPAPDGAASGHTESSADLANNGTAPSSSLTPTAKDSSQPSENGATPDSPSSFPHSYACTQDRPRGRDSNMCASRALAQHGPNVAFTGGLNCGNEYCGSRLGGSNGFRDSHCCVSGLAAAHLREAFVDAWDGREEPKVVRMAPKLRARASAASQRMQQLLDATKPRTWKDLEPRPVPVGVAGQMSLGWLVMYGSVARRLIRLGRTSDAAAEAMLKEWAEEGEPLPSSRASPSRSSVGESSRPGAVVVDEHAARASTAAAAAVRAGKDRLHESKEVAPEVQSAGSVEVDGDDHARVNRARPVSRAKIRDILREDAAEAVAAPSDSSTCAEADREDLRAAADVERDAVSAVRPTAGVEAEDVVPSPLSIRRTIRREKGLEGREAGKVGPAGGVEGDNVVGDRVDGGVERSFLDVQKAALGVAKEHGGLSGTASERMDDSCEPDTAPTAAARRETSPPSSPAIGVNARDEQPSPLSPSPSSPSSTSSSVDDDSESSSGALPTPSLFPPSTEPLSVFEKLDSNPATPRPVQPFQFDFPQSGATAKHGYPTVHPTESFSSVLTHVLVGDIRSSRTELYRVQRRVISSAQRELWIVTPYFVPPIRHMHAVASAARRGVKVTILTGAMMSTDPKWIFWASQFVLLSLTQLSHVRVFLYRNGSRGGAVMHAKLLSADGVYGSVGSFNQDALSHKNLECAVGCFDVRVATAVKEAIIADCLNADLLVARKVGFLFRIAAGAAYVFHWLCIWLGFLRPRGVPFYHGLRLSLSNMVEAIAYPFSALRQASGRAARTTAQRVRSLRQRGSSRLREASARFRERTRWRRGDGGRGDR